MSTQSDKKPLVGETMVMEKKECPHCGLSSEAAGLAVYAVNYIWNGERWVMLDTYEGGVLSAQLAASKRG